MYHMGSVNYKLHFILAVKCNVCVTIYVLCFSRQYALHVYDSLMAAGHNYGVQNAGYYALRALRIEKFFAYWGLELTPYATPLECGRELRVKFEVSCLPSQP